MSPDHQPDAVEASGAAGLKARASCHRCLRPAASCLCGWVRPTPNEVDVLILQHPQEVHEAKGTARLLQLSLRRCQLLVGEAWHEALLQTILSTPTPDGRPMHSVLLYPHTPPRGTSTTQGPLPSPSGLPPNGEPPPVLLAPHDALATRLIVLDGTWRKSLKMLHMNPVLQTLPRLDLAQAHEGAAQQPASPYAQLRKARRPGQFSTLEATCQALGQLEGQHERYAPLRMALEGFVSARLQQASINRPSPA
jgi:DTW domain-containing protein YfiP